jgi:anti-anti-sigma factor
MNTIQIEVNKDILIFKGILTFQTAMKALDKAIKLFPKDGILRIDLGGVSKSDSSALALITELMRRASRIGLGFEIHNIPKKMMDLARVSGLDTILSVRS